jgi:hypothetical protein
LAQRSARLDFSSDIPTFKPIQRQESACPIP